MTQDLPSTVSVPALPRRILYYAPTDLQFRRWFADIERVKETTVIDSRYPPQILFEGLSMVWLEESTPEGAMERLQSLYAHMVVLDLRYAPESEDIEQGILQGRKLLHLLDQVEDLESRYGFHRIVALVSGADPEHVDQLMVELGGVGIKHVIRQRTTRKDATPTEQEAISFATEVLHRITQMFHEPKRHRTALCLAGGGITGIYYELGALKCLDDCLLTSGPIPGVNRFDMYFGISAGSINCGMLAAGYSVEEFMASIAGVEGGRLPLINLQLMQLKHLNLRNGMQRAASIFRASFAAMKKAFQTGDRAGLERLLMSATELIGPPFHAEHFERLLRDCFSVPGTTNDFRRLPRELYIGATDQDLKRHVLFGGEGFADVPISKAIQASLSIHPAFSAVEIFGRYYEDGAVTRTSNFHEAIRRGAGLAFVFDPFLPYVSREPGYTHRRGMLYNLDQDIRTMSYTRYENTRNWVLRKHPDVSLYTFVPSNRTRHLISNNPMDHLPYLEIWKGAYLSTFRRIQAMSYRLRGDLESMGFTLDLDRATEVKERLERTTQLSFSDFFPEGVVQLRRPPLALRQVQATPGTRL